MGSTVRFNVKKCVGWALIVSTVISVLGFAVWLMGWSMFLSFLIILAIVLAVPVAFLIGLNLVC